MAEKDYAIPLDESSKQTGEATFEDFTRNGRDVTFNLTYITSGTSNILNLITNKGGTITNHEFKATAASGIASVTLSGAQISAVFSDADGSSWDYLRAKWTVGAVDSGGATNCTGIQGGQTYNQFGWPPN
ncbi:hypothetical protein KKC97_06695 [bacterium]|nr:hypothetical protein [bacterium]MBU1637339.1 hypothetical protein [bacterium]